MDNQEQLELLKSSVKEWNQWRKANPGIKIDLAYADLSAANLSSANLSDADISESDLTAANLSNANINYARLWGVLLIDADLTAADLTGADLTGAVLSRAILDQANLLIANLLDVDLTAANLSSANLEQANLSLARLQDANLDNAEISAADLSHAHLERANLNNADISGAMFKSTYFSSTVFTNAIISYTSFIDVDISGCKNLQSCHHIGPSYIDLKTFEKSGRISENFLRSAGVKSPWLDNIPKIVGTPIKFYDCFISYSRKNSDFAEKLHNDLFGKGITTWLDTHELKAGDRTREVIEKAIRQKDKVLLILSRDSINSDWVEKEVNAALRKEKSQKQDVLIPFRIDDSVMRCRKPWFLDLKDTRHFGDFRNWKDNNKYTTELNKMIDQLRRRNKN